MMFDCSRGRCPKYFGDVYTPVYTVAARSRSADHGDIVVLHACSTQFAWLPAVAVFAYADQQFGTNFHRICETRTLRNSLNVGLSTGYVSVCTAEGASHRHFNKIHRIVSEQQLL